ncbi:MAG: exodeoxyribonuclease V subunit gamma [Proteobacteria bacterium]|nr:exodeoxyribonuclease V subunit gamma [Pseudomonadota bacterium]
MFYLHLSNRTENLIRHLAEVLGLDEGRDPFSREYFLIQSQGMERMLSQCLAEAFTSWCNYEYMLPTRFFAMIGGRLDVAAGPEDYERERVCWHLENILRRVDDDRFAPLQRYVADDSNGMKRYQLAQQLAYVFDQYQIMRLGMIDGWGQGKLSTRNPAEIYQMELWNLLRQEIGHSRHRGVFLRDLIGLLGGAEDFSSLLPTRLSVFGLHSIPPLLLNCLQALAHHCEVHFYLLSPCENYWVEQVTPRGQLRQNISSLQQGQQVTEVKTMGHPLLGSLGQQGREFQEMLLEDIDFSMEFRSFADPLDEAAPCLLHRLQSDLLRGDVLPEKMPLPKDDSLIVTSAHSPYREMMILKDRILHWLDREPELELRDIVVMAPDIQEYSGLVPAVFHDIPHSIADRNPALNNSFIAVFLQFLKLCSSRFGWSEVLDLLERENVYPRFEIREADLEMIRHWAVSSGVRWGLSGKQRREMGLPDREECTWQSGLERLMMGYAVTASETVAGILPYEDIEGSMGAPLGGLSLFLEILEEARDEFATSHSLEEWARILALYADRLFVADGNDNLVELYGILVELGQEYGTLHHHPLTLEVIRSWVEGAATGKKSSSGFLRGQLTFCSMLPMRSIPFKKVCLVGLNDTVFPKNDRHPPFDLLGDQFLPGDRSRRSDDRYQFLEAILSARSSLYLSYVGQSIRNNEKIPPSVVVSELIELVESSHVDGLVDSHPLHGFSSKYFSKNSSFFSYDHSLSEVTTSLQNPCADSVPWWNGSLDVVQEEELAVSDFFSFFRHPQRYFVRNVLGVRLDYGAATLEEREPFALDPLQNYLVEQELVHGGLQGKEGGHLLHLLQVKGQWPLGRPGEVSFLKKEDELQDFVARIKEQEEVGREVDCLVDLQLDGLHLLGKLTSLYANGSFLSRYARLKGKDILSAWIHHCLAAACLGKATETRLVAKDKEVLFPAGSGGKEDLNMLATLFLEGQRAPSPLLLEPAWAYVEQLEKTSRSGKGSPMAKAAGSYVYSLEQGMEPEWGLLYQGQSPETVLGQEFVDLCDWFFQSIWSRANVTEL